MRNSKQCTLPFDKHQKETVSPAAEETAVDGKSEVDAPVKKITGAFQKAPYLLAAEIHPEKKIYSSGFPSLEAEGQSELIKLWISTGQFGYIEKGLSECFHLYCYASKEEAESQLALIKELIGAKHFQLKEQILENQSDEETTYSFSLSSQQEERLNKIKTHPRLLKSIRWDSYCFLEDFILGITPIKNSPRHRQNLRRGRHKKFTTFSEGVFSYAERPSPYPEKQLYKKEKRSQHQPTSLVTRKAQIPVFGHSKDRMNKLAGVILDADDALVNRYFIYDSGTVKRPYEADSFSKAKAYHQRVTDPDNPLLFSDRKAFEKALEKNTEKHNEVLARIRWNLTSSSIGIFNDSFEARCVARYYAERIYTAVKTQYEASGKSWDETYQIPVTYYLPGNDKNWTSYSEKSRQEDTEKAQSIYSNPRRRHKAIEEAKGEFLLLLNEPQAVWQSLLDDASHPLLTMIKQGQFQLVEALYRRTGHEEALEDALKPYAKTLHQQPEILSELFIKNDKGRTLLYQTAESNRLGILQFILELDKEKKLLNELDNHGRTPLFIAAQEGHLDVVQALLKKGANVNKTNKNGITPLHIAAQNGHIDVVLALLKKEADVNQAYKNGVCPLQIAAHHGHLDVVLALLKKGADVDQAGEYNKTPLCIAVIEGHLDVVKALLEHGADANIDRKYGAASILRCAVMEDQLEIILALLENGADAKEAIDKGEFIHLRAARLGNTDILQWMADNQPELLAQKDSVDGRTIAHYAVKSENTAVLQWIDDNLPELLIQKDNDDQNIAHHAALRGNTKGLQWVADNQPALLIEKDNKGRTIAHFAAQSGNPEALQWVADNLPELLTEKDKFGRTITHFAALSEKPDILNKALNLSETPNSFTMNDFIDEYSGIETLLLALEDNFTLTMVTPSNKKLEKKLARNQRLEKATQKFSEDAQGYFQKESPLSVTLLDELFNDFKQRISRRVPEKHARIAFDKAMYNASPEGRLQNIIKKFSQKMPDPRHGKLFRKKPNKAKLRMLSELKAIIDADHLSLDDLKESLIGYYNQYKTIINQRNKLQRFFRPNHKRTTGKMFDEMFDVLDITAADMSAAVR